MLMMLYTSPRLWMCDYFLIITTTVDAAAIIKNLPTETNNEYFVNRKRHTQIILKDS